MRPKGMQHLTTLAAATVVKAPGLHSSIAATGKSGSRAQAASEFAQLERERVRLEQKLDMQAVLRAQTEARLEIVTARLDVVRRELEPVSGGAGGGASRSTGTHRRATRSKPAAAHSRHHAQRTPPPAAVRRPEVAVEPAPEDDGPDPFEIIPFQY